MPKVTVFCPGQKKLRGSSFAQGKRSNQRFILGVTGGIASGKTTAMRLLAHAGVATVSADELAHACIKRGQPAYRTVIRIFGKEILASNGDIDRRKLGRIVFADRQARRRLEKIIHPCVFRGLRRFVRGRSGLVAVDIPLLYEAGYEKWVDAVLVVFATKAQQIKRLRQRNGLSRQQALQRISAQMPLSTKCRKADIVIQNTATPSHLRHQLFKWLTQQC